eukprot:SAG31_NODE_12644_length_927_cov_1.437198_2_plen_85_part_00
MISNSSGAPAVQSSGTLSQATDSLAGIRGPYAPRIKERLLLQDLPQLLHHPRVRTSRAAHFIVLFISFYLYVLSFYLYRFIYNI